MNHYLYLTVKEKSTGFTGMVISVDEILGLAIQFSFGVKWLKENEIEIIEGLMRFCRCFAQHHTEDIRYKEAEQFLKL